MELLRGNRLLPSRCSSRSRVVPDPEGPDPDEETTCGPTKTGGPTETGGAGFPRGTKADDAECVLRCCFNLGRLEVDEDSRRNVTSAGCTAGGNPVVGNPAVDNPGEGNPTGFVGWLVMFRFVSESVVDPESRVGFNMGLICPV